MITLATDWRAGWLADNAVVILEHGRKADIPSVLGPLSQVKRYDYGDTALTRFTSRRKKPKIGMKTAVYPGTFDPITHGPDDIIRRGFRMFTRVIVAIAPNPGKHPLFSTQERLDMVRLVTKDLPNLEVTTFEGLLVDFVRTSGAHAILRGLRAISDFEHEFQMALVNENWRKPSKRCSSTPSEEYSYLSSTIIKDVAGHGEGL